MYCDFCEEIRTPKYSQEQIIICLMLFILFCLPGLIYLIFIDKKTCNECENIIVISTNDKVENNDIGYDLKEEEINIPNSKNDINKNK